MKRRKMARIPSSEAADSCASMMQHMDINAAPLGSVTDSPLPERRRPTSRMSSSSTTIYTPTDSTPTARRVSNSAKKSPLGVDLSFGNSHSTVRHFKRVSSGERRAALSSNPPPLNANSFHPNPNAKTFRPTPPNSATSLTFNDENEPPATAYQPMPITKDALYGRRAYSKVMDSVFQEAYANSASPHQREALGGMHQAWAHLDQVDPQGEFLLLKAMIDRLQNDSKLASALGIAVSPTPTPKHSTKSSETSLSGATVHGTSTTRIRSSTTTTNSSSYSKTSTEYSSTPQRDPFQTPAGTPSGNSSNSPLKGPKLVLAQNNPHLKSHRRRQSAIVTGEKVYGSDGYALDEKKLPGHVEPGMEQQGLLADILYGQWMQGLKSRWPLA